MPSGSATKPRRSWLWNPSIRCWNSVSANNSAMTRGWPNFNDGAFSPSSVTVGCRQHPTCSATELQRRRLLTVLGDGRLHYTLDAVAAQAAVMADTFDFQQAPIDLPANLL